MKYRAASLTRSVDDASSRSASSDASVTTDVRTEYDSLGAVEMPADGYGARIAGAFQHRARPDAVRDHHRLRALGGDRQCPMSSIVSPVDRDRFAEPHLPNRYYVLCSSTRNQNVIRFTMSASGCDRQGVIGCHGVADIMGRGIPYPGWSRSQRRTTHHS